MRAGDPVRLLRTCAGLAAGSCGIVCGADPDQPGALRVAFEDGVTTVPQDLLADSPPGTSVALAAAVRVLGHTASTRGTDLWSFLAWINRVIARRAEQENCGTGSL
jgi:hypothetical protein